MQRVTGKLVLVVGPSGAGKDSLLRRAARDLSAEWRIVFPRRTITRSDDDASEDHDCATVASFMAAQERGDFALSWTAHGLHYGIPASICDSLRTGNTVVINASRTIIAAAAMRFANLAILHVTAPPAVIAQRLTRRRRETAAEIERRIARAPPPIDTGLETVTVLNDGSLDQAAASFTAALRKFAGIDRAEPV